MNVSIASWALAYFLAFALIAHAISRCVSLLVFIQSAAQGSERREHGILVAIDGS